VVGATSFGKGSVQTIAELPNQGELFLTSSRYYVPSGITIDQQGVLPTVCTSIDAETPAEVVAAFRAGELPSPRELEPLRRRAPEDEAALAQVRAACEWEPREAEFDIQVAIEFLTDRTLYQQALSAQQVTLAAR
jgi:carboxyl-terminal processing protease